MDKYKIVGVINLLFGIFQIVCPLFFILFTVPRVIEMYSEFNVQGPSPVSAYLVLGFVILIGISNLSFGFNLVSKSKKKEEYFKYALILVIVSFLIGGILLSFASLSVILPIFNLTSHL